MLKKIPQKLVGKAHLGRLQFQFLFQKFQISISKLQLKCIETKTPKY